MEELKNLSPPDPNDPPISMLATEAGNVMTEESGEKFLAPEK
jgi:hypothetical protein